MPKVSVICTVKNGENVIGETIESIRNQTFRDWEFIIVDDGSNDNTSTILSEYEKIDFRLKIIPTEGIGRGKALNLAIENTTGKYIANVDADDPSHPRRIEMQVKSFMYYNNYDLISTESMIVKKNGILNWDYKLINNLQIENITRILTIKNPIHHSSIMVKSSVIRDIGGYNTKRDSRFDYDLWVRMAVEGYRLGKITIPLAAKRIHENQSFDNKGKLKTLIPSLKIQYTAIKRLKGPRYLYFLLIGRLLYGIIPRSLRATVMLWTKRL